MNLSLTMIDVMRMIREEHCLSASTEINIKGITNEDIGTTFQCMVWNIISHPENCKRMLLYDFLQQATTLTLNKSKEIINGIHSDRSNNVRKTIFFIDQFIQEVEDMGGAWKEDVDLNELTKDLPMTHRKIQLENIG